MYFLSEAQCLQIHLQNYDVSFVLITSLFLLGTFCVTHNQDSFLIQLRITVPLRAPGTAASTAVLGEAPHRPRQSQGHGWTPVSHPWGKGGGQQKRNSANFTVQVSCVADLSVSASQRTQSEVDLTLFIAGSQSGHR